MTRCAALLLALAVAAGVAAGCGGDDEVGAAALDVVPALDGGTPYFDADVSGACTTDCPDPSRSAGVLVECDGSADVVASYERALDTAGFQRSTADAWTTEVEGVAVTVELFVYDDASVGPMPNGAPYVEPGDVAGRCGVVTSARATSP